MSVLFSFTLEVKSIEVHTPINVNRGSTRGVYDDGIDRHLPGGETQIELKDGKEITFDSVDVTDKGVLIE